MRRLPRHCHYFVLQKDLPQADRAALKSHPQITCFESELQNFTDTAALIENMDLVITVDTSPAHLSGALGKPTWLLLPFVPDWRWLLEREDTPWYPSMHLCRQTARGDWDSAFAHLLARAGL
jgi:ADP-heptose:LPS heptosyltransferase